MFYVSELFRVLVSNKNFLLEMGGFYEQNSLQTLHWKYYDSLFVNLWSDLNHLLIFSCVSLFKHVIIAGKSQLCRLCTLLQYMFT